MATAARCFVSYVDRRQVVAGATLDMIEIAGYSSP
jgi:hypothetical protein